MNRQWNNYDCGIFVLDATRKLVDRLEQQSGSMANCRTSADSGPIGGHSRNDSGAYAPLQH
ncbi:hypothetical protein ACVWXO_000519 [Bradyrhizobium sp. LM2.7]